MSGKNNCVVPALIMVVLIAAVSLLFGARAEAGINKWTSQGPFGGSVKALAVDPSDLSAQTVFAGIDGGGVFRTVNGGLDWVDVTNNLGDPRVQALAFDNQGNLYAGTNGGGVYRTTDDGATWTAVNGLNVTPTPAVLVNQAVLSVVAHPDIDNLLFAGTNGGGIYRGVFQPGDNDVEWEEQNLGLGNRVIFDLQIPRPLAQLVINEVDARTSDDTMFEYIELFGPPNQPLEGLTLVLFDGVVAVDIDPIGGCPATPPQNPAYAAYDLDGFTLDNNGFFVIGDPGVPGVDSTPVGFNLINTAAGVTDSAVVALYFGDAEDFYDPPTVVAEPNTDYIDVIPYQTGGGDNDECLMLALGLDGTHINEAGVGGVNANSVSRLPDGGLRADLDRMFSADNTPSTRNVPLTTLFAATDLEGVYRTDGLNDTPIFWAPINNGLTSDVVFSLAVDPVDPNVQCALDSYTVYAGTSGQGVFRSTDPCDLDLEEDWLPKSSGLPPNTTVTAMAVAPLIDPLSPFESVIYAGTELGDVYKSTSQGDTWALRSNGLGGLRVDSMTVEPRIYGAQDPLRPSRIYAGTLGAGVYKTVDSASNWFLTSPELAGTIGVFVNDVVVNPIDPTRVFAGTFGGGVFRSLDAGQSWAPRSNGLTSFFSNALAMDPDTPTTLYLGTDVAGAFKTTNSGGVWSPLGGLAETAILDVEIDPANPLRVYAATGDLWRSVNGGTSWTNISTDTTDGFNDSAIQTVTIDPTDPNTLYAGTQDRGLFRSTDGGVEWQRIGQGSLNENFIRTIAVDPDAPTTLYAGTDGAGVFKTVDDGETWLPKNNGLSDSAIILAVTLDPEDSQILYLGTDGNDPVTGGVFRSIDGGENWAAFNTGLTNYVVKEVRVATRLAPNDPKVLQAATFGGGVFDFIRVELFDIEPMTGLVTTESGGTASFSISLLRIPSSNVVIEIESSNPMEGVPDLTSILFTPANATTPQTVVVTGQADGVPDGDQAYSIKLLPAVSSDPFFSGVDPDDVSVTNLDVIPVPPGVLVNPTGGLVTTETGGTASFQVVLRTTPSANVTINLSSSDQTEGTVAPQQLTFSPANALVPQMVTITGVQDGVADGSQGYQVVLDPAASSDTNYSGIDPPDVSVVNEDSGFATLFETAALGPVGQASAPGMPVASQNVFLGAKFTVMETVTVASLGGHLVADGANDPTIFVAVVPLVGAPPNDFPSNFQLTTAVFAGQITAPQTSAQVSINTDFTLEPGRYAIIFGSGRFGASGRARMPANDTDIGTPSYFFSDNGAPQWVNGGFDGARFFLSGFIGIPPLFADGFESGDTSAWSVTVP